MNDDDIIDYYYSTENPVAFQSLARYKAHLLEKFNVNVSLSHLKFLLNKKSDFVIKREGKSGNFSSIVSSNQLGEGDVITLLPKTYALMLCDTFSNRIYLKLLHSHHTLKKIIVSIKDIIAENDEKFPFATLRTDKATEFLALEKFLKKYSVRMSFVSEASTHKLPHLDAIVKTIRHRTDLYTQRFGGNYANNFKIMCDFYNNTKNPTFNYKFAPIQINEITSIVARKYRTTFNKESNQNFSKEYNKNLKILKRFYAGRNDSQSSEFFVNDRVKIHKTALHQTSKFFKKRKSLWSEEVFTVSKINPQKNMFYVPEKKTWYYRYDLKLV